MMCNTVLIIEDDPEIRELLRLVIEMEGYTVMCASNGQEGLELLAKIEHPCLILLDFMMPIMDGRTFAETVNKDVVLSAIPIVLVTAYSEKAANMKTVRSIVKKPVDMDMLMKIVKKYCNNGQVPNQTREI